MDPIIKREIEKIRTEAPETSQLTDDYLFGVVGYKYFFNQGQYSNSDFKNSHTDSAYDGGIDLIGIEETDSEKILVLIQSKNISTTPNKDDIMSIFVKMAQTVEEFKNRRDQSFNDKLKRIYKEKHDLCFDEGQLNRIKLILFLGIELTNQQRDLFSDYLANVEQLQNFEFDIIDEQEIISSIS